MKHHPTISFNFKTVSVYTFTHFAQPSSDLLMELSRDVVPGLTLRDIRLALLIEETFDKLLETGKAIRKWNQFTTMRPNTFESLNTIRGAPGKSRIQKPCYACGSKSHMLKDCPQRYTTSPTFPCRICGGKHWVIDCPVSQNHI